MNPLRPDAVFDCNVLLQAVSRANGPAARALRLVDQNSVLLHISRSVLNELRRTLDYPEIRQRNPSLTNEVITSFLNHVRYRGQMHRDVPHRIDYARDPADEPYLDLAIECKADFLVTRDADLLDLRSGHSEEAKKFHQQLPGLRIVDPVEFLNALSHAAD